MLLEDALARVASELQQRKLGEFCSVQRDSANTIPLYRRATKDGTVPPVNPPMAAPAPKK